MKTLFFKLITLSMFAFILGSCDKKEDAVVATTGRPATVTATTSTMVLQKNTQNDKVVTFTITNPDFGYNAVITNTLQLAVKGTNFSNFVEASFETKATTKEFTGAEFNKLVLGLNIPTEKPSNIEARIKSSISSQYAAAYSNVMDLVVTPYASTSWVYLPGAYQGWDPSKADSLVSLTGNGVHIGIIKFTPSNLGFKILTKKSWGPPEYGKGSSDETLAIGGGDLVAPGAGFYKLTADLNALTLSMVPYSFGIIGSATPTGWNSDTDMEYNNGTRTWNLTLPLVAGAIKFRLNDDWGTNYGGSGGTLASGGSDINITEAGNYKVSFSLETNTYTLTKL